MERPNATLNDICTQIIQNDSKLEVFSKLLINEEQTKANLATIGQEIKKLSIRVERISRQCRSSDFTDIPSRSTGKTKNYKIL